MVQRDTITKLLLYSTTAYHFGEFQTFSQLVLNWFVELHEPNIGEVPTKQDECLPPLNLFVEKKGDQQNQGHRIEEHIADQRPSRKAETQDKAIMKGT